MRLSFIYPLALLLLALLPLLWGFTLLARGGSAARAPWRFWASLGLRTVALLALVLALAGTQLVRPVSALTVVFLIDGSDSVAPAQREQATEIVSQALRAKKPGDQAAVVLFGENALVERAPSPLVDLGRLTSTPIGTRTDIAEAIQLGLALFPADQQKRLVLLSDGGENSGRALEAARIAASRGVPLDVVPLRSAPGADVLVSALDAPDSVREGQEAKLLARLRSTIATTGRLQVFADGSLAGEREVQLPEGDSAVEITLPAGDTGFHRYEVRLEAQGDTQAINNRAAAFTTVQGPPRVLIAASDAARAEPLRQALAAASVRADVVAPAALPADQAQLSQYAAVLLVDVLARDVPRAVQEALPVYVRDLGRGLAMIGGGESFGAGGWRRTPVADVLPVELDPIDKTSRPDLGLVLVIDRSGSMSDASSGITKLDLAKEAVYQSSLGLERNDQLGVIAFDDGSSWALPIQRLPDPVQIEQALSTIGLGGGTNIRSGIEPAERALAAVDAKTKHVILLTDGIADSNYSDLIDRMRSQQTTISIVSIGSDANPGLEQIAERGGGRFYRVERLGDVPRIFLAETVLVAGRDIVERQFVPAIALRAPVVRDFEALPPLYGYNATEQRPAARNILVTPDGKPVLAQWQYGLGRSVAWTSDLKAQWARDWVGWEGFPRFVNGLLDSLLPPPTTQGLSLEARTETSSASAIFELTAADPSGRPLDALALEGRLLDPSQSSAQLSFVQIAPGRYRATMPAGEPGVYLAQVAATAPDGTPVGSVSSGLVVSYSPEYSARRDNPQLLQELARITGGRAEPAPAAMYVAPNQPVGIVQEMGLPLLWLALLLLPLDIGVRRLLLRRSDFAPLFARLRRRNAAAPAPAEPTLARLRTAVQTQRAAPRAARARAPIEAPPLVNGREAPAAPLAPPPPAPTEPTIASAPAEGDDTLARLRAARQRARRK
jgi:Mg-chelatase subunit ChlD